MNNLSESNSQEAVARSALSILKWSFHKTNIYFFSLCKDISFPLILLICVFVPLWVAYIQRFGLEHWLVKVFELCMNGSLWLFVLCMVGFCLFNKTHSKEQSLKLWPFTKSITWPLLIEGLKATVIICAGFFLFIIPGFVKQVHFTFLTFVIFFNRLYHQGELKALQHSQKLSRGLGWSLFVLAIVIPSFVHEIVGQVKQFLHFPVFQYEVIRYPALILCVYINSLIIVYLFSILYFMYVTKDREQMIHYTKA